MSNLTCGFNVPDYAMDKKKIGPELLCTSRSCAGIIRDPVQTLCGHRYCRGCLVEILREDKTCESKDCCENGEELEYEEKCGARTYFYPDKYIEKVVSKIVTTCGSHWKGTLVEWEKHTEQCDYGTTACPDYEEVVPKNKLIKSNEESGASCNPPPPIQASEDEAGSRALLLLPGTGRVSHPALNTECLPRYDSSGNLKFSCKVRSSLQEKD